ncbi:hypothetical protein Salat_0242300 [Sesamum alatum]|uniref:Uncharacterized protein n=1 Tax=Sesamum alatum TaxID=300844 RepID=A0AAE1YYN3_9LAMI|nr:hypothetical protein Salat_0242300 [Sesamum alatum]
MQSVRPLEGRLPRQPPAGRCCCYSSHCNSQTVFSKEAGETAKPTKEVHQLNVPVAGNNDQDLPGLSKPQSSLKGQGQPILLRQSETDVMADSSGSSNEPDSPTSTQHLVSGTKITAIAGRKLKQQLRGESPPQSP